MYFVNIVMVNMATNIVSDYWQLEFIWKLIVLISVTGAVVVISTSGAESHYSRSGVGGQLWIVGVTALLIGALIALTSAATLSGIARIVVLGVLPSAWVCSSLLTSRWIPNALPTGQVALGLTVVLSGVSTASAAFPLLSLTSSDPAAGMLLGGSYLLGACLVLAGVGVVCDSSRTLALAWMGSGFGFVICGASLFSIDSVDLALFIVLLGGGAAFAAVGISSVAQVETARTGAIALGGLALLSAAAMAARDHRNLLCAGSVLIALSFAAVVVARVRRRVGRGSQPSQALLVAAAVSCALGSILSGIDYLAHDLTVCGVLAILVGTAVVVFVMGSSTRPDSRKQMTRHLRRLLQLRLPGYVP